MLLKLILMVIGDVFCTKANSSLDEIIYFQRVERAWCVTAFNELIHLI